MLSSQVPETPRPRPPAKARRSSSGLKASPPPPYDAASRASSITSRLESIDWEGLRRSTPHASPAAEEWMNEHSREDISGLLSKADGLIKGREADISATSAAFRSLQEDSRALKNRHEAFLRRIPSPVTSPAASTFTSPANPNSALPNSPHYYSGSLSNLSPDVNSILRARHTRKISVSHNDISQLSDQNAELLSKVEKLESESLQTEQAGRRRLRNLEKEIQGLREELDKSRCKSDEFEAQAKLGLNVDAEKVVEDVWRKKLGREEKIRAIRGHFSSRDDGDVIDFAPRNPITTWNTPQASSSKILRRAPSMPITPVAFRFPSQPIGSVNRQDEDDVFSSAHSAIRSESASPGQELAVVSQLLSKIQELEEANSYISEQQARSASKLHAVQQDAESIRRVYECLGDSEDIQWEIVSEDDPVVAGNETLRFQSLRRRLDSIHSPVHSHDGFAGEIADNMQSTVHDAALVGISASHRPRKSLTGLFDPPPEASTSPLAVPFGDASVGWDSEDSMHTRSLSAISIVASPSPGERPTLSNELGDQWNDGAGSHHLRDDSLYNLISPIASPALHVNPLPEQPTSKASTFAGRLKFPPVPESSSSASARDQKDFRTARYRRMSQTVRGRANQLTGGRFKESLLGSRSNPGNANTGMASLPQSLMSVFESMAGSDKPHPDASMEVATKSLSEEEALESAEREEDRHDATPSTSSAMVRTAGDQVRVSKVVLELWLWLQFAIIILVFLWAVAKRGPRNVLRDAEKRRATRS